MKILLIGEFSGLFTNLKSGLIELGQDVTHAATGKKWGNNNYDIQLLPEINNKKIEKFYRQVMPCSNINKLEGFDVVQFINPAIMGVLNPFNSVIGGRIIKASERSYLSATGDDSYYFDSRHNLRYNPLDEAKKIDFGGRMLTIEYPWAKHWTQIIAKKVNGVIPVAYDYAQAYRKIPGINLRNTISPSIDLASFKYIGCCNNGIKKIKVFHGINRRGYKGTQYIEKAFEILRKKYSTRAEFIICDPMNFDEFLKYIINVDIIVDQTNSYSCGMTGIIGLALGKIVLSGSEPESLNELNINYSPVINITPDVDYIVNKLSELIELENYKLRDIGIESRLFAEEHHCNLKNAAKYLKEWLV